MVFVIVVFITTCKKLRVMIYCCKWDVGMMDDRARFTREHYSTLMYRRMCVCMYVRRALKERRSRYEYAVV